MQDDQQTPQNILPPLPKNKTKRLLGFGTSTPDSDSNSNAAPRRLLTFGWPSKSNSLHSTPTISVMSNSAILNSNSNEMPKPESPNEKIPPSASDESQTAQDSTQNEILHTAVIAPQNQSSDVKLNRGLSKSSASLKKSQSFKGNTGRKPSLKENVPDISISNGNFKDETVIESLEPANTKKNQEGEPKQNDGNSPNQLGSKRPTLAKSVSYKVSNEGQIDPSSTTKSLDEKRHSVVLTSMPKSGENEHGAPDDQKRPRGSAKISRRSSDDSKKKSAFDVNHTRDELEKKKEKRAIILFEYIDECKKKERNEAYRVLQEKVVLQRQDLERKASRLETKRLQEEAKLEQQRKDALQQRKARNEMIARAIESIPDDLETKFTAEAAEALRRARTEFKRTHELALKRLSDRHKCPFTKPPEEYERVRSLKNQNVCIVKTDQKILQKEDLEAFKLKYTADENIKDDEMELIDGDQKKSKLEIKRMMFKSATFNRDISRNVTQTGLHQFGEPSRISKSFDLTVKHARTDRDVTWKLAAQEDEDDIDSGTISRKTFVDGSDSELSTMPPANVNKMDKISEKEETEEEDIELSPEEIAILSSAMQSRRSSIRLKSFAIKKNNSFSAQPNMENDDNQTRGNAESVSESSAEKSAQVGKKSSLKPIQSPDNSKITNDRKSSIDMKREITPVHQKKTQFVELPNVPEINHHESAPPPDPFIAKIETSSFEFFDRQEEHCNFPESAENANQSIDTGKITKLDFYGPKIIWEPLQMAAIAEFLPTKYPKVHKVAGIARAAEYATHLSYEMKATIKIFSDHNQPIITSHPAVVETDDEHISIPLKKFWNPNFCKLC